MKVITILLLTICLSFSAAQAEGYNLPDYYRQSDFLTTAPSVSGDVSGAFFNPAVWGLTGAPEVKYFWNDLEKRGDQAKNWALIFGGKNIGFSVQHWDYLETIDSVEYLSLIHI